MIRREGRTHVRRLAHKLGLVVISALVVTVLMATAPRTWSAEAGAASSAENAAVVWATKMIGSPQGESGGKYWYGCLAFVVDAYQVGAAYPIRNQIPGLGANTYPADIWPVGQSSANVSGGTQGTDSSPPAGALVFWDSTGGIDDSHVAISIGGGELISTNVDQTYVSGYNGIHEESMAQFAKNSWNIYKGWWLPDGTSSTGPTTVTVTNNEGVMGVQLANFPTGTGHFFCHSGPASDYPTGGNVGPDTAFTISASDESWSSGFCAGSGNFWLGVQAPGGNSYYSNQITLGTGSPSITATNNNGQMGVALANFPTGSGHYFCHWGSGYPTGGFVGPDTAFTISSSNQSWSSGFCSGTGNFWLGIQAPDGNSYYSNQIYLGSGAPLSITISNDNGTMEVQLANFPTGTGHFFCHSGPSSDYPTGGNVGPDTAFTVNSANEYWPNGFCSGSGNYWLGIQAPDGGYSVYSNQIALGPNVAGTSVGVSSTGSPAPFGSTVTYLAYVTGDNGTDTDGGGHVEFFDGSSPLTGCTNLSLSAAGTTSCRVSSPSVGTHFITASYSGDSAYYPSTSAAYSQQVVAAETTLQAFSSPHAVHVGRPVMLYVRLLPHTARGSVVFTWDSRRLCSGQVSAGFAECRAPIGLGKGSYEVVAHYRGDSDYDSSQALTRFRIV